MPARKKRPSSPKSAHIAVQSQVSTLEDMESTVQSAPSEVESPAAITEKTAPSKPEPSKQAVVEKQESLEAMLASDASEPELTRKNIWLYRFGMLTTGCIIVCSLIIYIVYLKSSVTPAVSSLPVPVPTPVPTITVELNTITLEIRNGSGVAGIASKTAEIFKSKGYSIIGTGNAKKIPQTTVTFATTVSTRAKEILLSDLQSMGYSSISAVFADSTVSAQITLGFK